MSNSVLNDYVKQLNKHPAVIAGRRGLRWWIAELAAFLPSRLQSQISADTPLVELVGSQVIVRRQDKGRISEVARVEKEGGAAAEPAGLLRKVFAKYGLDPEKIVLCLSADRVLRKKLSFPLAAEENLRQVLIFEMDRHTPFKADDVYFDVKVLSRDAQPGKMDVQLVVVPRALANADISSLGGWNFRPSCLTSLRSIENNESIDLLPEGLRAKSTQLPAKWIWVFASLLLVVMMAAIMLPILIKREVVVNLLPMVAKARQAAEVTEEMRTRLDARIAEHDYLLKKKRTLPPTVMLLDELSRLLPDDTWVNLLELRGTELQLQGETASSSNLIGVIAKSPFLSDASFRSPLTKMPQSNNERFHVAVTVKPLPESELVKFGKSASGEKIPPPAQPPKPAQGQVVPAPAVPPQPTVPAATPKPPPTPTPAEQGKTPRGPAPAATPPQPVPAATPKLPGAVTPPLMQDKKQGTLPTETEKKH